MRAIFDTNILLSALINPHGLPAQLIDAWRSGRFKLITSRTQLTELADVSRRDVVRQYIVPPRVGRFINDLHLLADVLQQLPAVDRSPDPADNFLLAMCDASQADYLVTGDKRDVLSLKRHSRTHIVTPRYLFDLLKLG